MGSTNSLLTDSAHDNSQKLTWKSLNKSQSPSKLPIKPLHFSSTRRLLTSLPNIYQASTKRLPSVYSLHFQVISLAMLAFLIKSHRIRVNFPFANLGHSIVQSTPSIDANRRNHPDSITKLSNHAKNPNAAT